ncbi:YciI family protein [Shewanella surugensis]|uniref:YciI family protein n=1 Tax=Shewanella surugensis TaxID=212020 RepID=A0ABT0LEX6_9GAMM|nr:YciI family protein [Shewanella surugensis]MCL1126257.1 YciI family protein [Shewanella surugensis]
MFIIKLSFSFEQNLDHSETENKAKAFMPEHLAWLQRGFDKGVFLLSGSLQPELGGGIIAHNISREALDTLLREDPFVTEQIVTPEIIEILPSKTDDRLNFLLD